MKSFQLAIAVGASALAVASAANAVNLKFLTEGTGWHYGQMGKDATHNKTTMYNYDNTGDVSFKLEAVVTQASDDLSFVDGFVKGDVYSVRIQPISGTGTVSYTTQFLNDTFFNPIPQLYAGPFGHPFGNDWLDGGYGHLQAQLSPGTYVITVTDLCGQRGNPKCPGFPAGWGIRLDANVPEPGTWALMLVGVGGLGAGLRHRRRAAIA